MILTIECKRNMPKDTLLKLRNFINDLISDSKEGKIVVEISEKKKGVGEEVSYIITSSLVISEVGKVSVIDKLKGWFPFEGGFITSYVLG